MGKCSKFMCHRDTRGRERKRVSHRAGGSVATGAGPEWSGGRM